MQVLQEQKPVLRRTQAVVLSVLIQETVEQVLHRGGLIHHTPPGL
jgi:hypothetical protein